MAAIVFYLLAALTVLSALGVALSKNILYSGFALLGALLGVAGLYFYVGADFLGAAQLLIYVGGILVLILFAVLLTNKIADVKISNRSAGLVAGGAGTALLAGMLIQVALGTRWPQVKAAAAPTTGRLGDALLGEYLLPFELASLVLLMALVGAMVIARRAAREPPKTSEEAAAKRRLE